MKNDEHRTDEQETGKLKQVLRHLHEATPEELPQAQRDAERYFHEVEPQKLAKAEQELVQEGVAREEMKRLCHVHLEVMKKLLGAPSENIQLPSWHPIQIAMDEHREINANLKCLKEVAEELASKDSFEQAAAPIDALKELSHFFLETEKHHRREEEALFPFLERHNITEPPRIFREDHVEFLEKKRILYDLVMNAGNAGFRAFRDTLKPIADFLTQNLEEHIYKEDNILYPMALTVLSDEEWKEVRRRFDAIGYCCYTPHDLRPENGDPGSL